jgi:protein-S-isoprenylcysteine O-methyltransferase Ste14
MAGRPCLFHCSHTANLGLALAKLPIATVIACAETTFLGALLAWQAVRLWPAIHHDPANLALLISDGLPVLLVLVRRPAQAVTLDLADWLSAAAAAAAPTLLSPGGHPLVDPRLCGALMVLGLLLNLYGKASLARSFGLVAANRGIKRLGPYRIIRHPIYAGAAITQIGFLLANPTAFNLALCAAAMTLQVIRLKAEEKLLGQDPVYAQYMAEVPYRLAPGVF